MCKTWAVVHTCGHTVSFRLSTCLATYTHTARTSGNPVSLCSGAPSWGFQSQLRCGSCQRADEEQRLEAEIAQLRAELAGEEDWLVDAEQRYSTQQWKLQGKFPDGRFKKCARPEPGRRPTRTTSLLRNEVKPEDLPELPQPEGRPSKLCTPSWEAQWNWAAGWASLDDEIAEDAKAREDAGLPTLWEDHGRSDLDLIDGESAPAEPESPPPLQEPESPPPGDAMYWSDEEALFTDDSHDPEEDLFTFPQERFLAVSAPVEDHTTHSASSVESENWMLGGRIIPFHERRRKRASPVHDLAEQVSHGLKSLHNCGRWPVELSMAR